MKQQLAEIASSCWYCVGIKGVSSLVIGGYAFLFGFQNTETVCGIVALVVFDLLTGMIAARRNGQKIESKKAWKTAVKLAAYGMLLSASYVTTKIIPDVGFIFTVMAAFLALTELISVLENTGKMGYSIPNKLLGQLEHIRDDK